MQKLIETLQEIDQVWAADSTQFQDFLFWDLLSRQVVLHKENCSGPRDPTHVEQVETGFLTATNSFPLSQ